MSDSEISETPLEELLQKHRREKKELQAKVQILKKSKGDKKKKKEVTEEIAQLENDLSAKHAKELAELKPDENEEIKKTTETKSPDEALENLTEGLQNVRMGKAQRRRDKKDLEARERQERIREQEIENTHGVRNKEIEAIKKILRGKNLMIQEIPSDGNCLYSAVLHQKPICSIVELRQRTASAMLEDPDQYLPYLTSKSSQGLMAPEEFADYCKHLATSSAWGGQVEVRALTHVLKCPIRIVQATGPAIFIGEEYSEDPVILCYHRHMYRLGAHYNSVRPLEADDEEEFEEPK